MNDNYIVRYVDIDGNIKVRKLLQRIQMIPFAGTKFIFDRIFSIFFLIILSPLMLIIALLIKIDSKGPVLFKQERTGKNGKNFNVYKFRTMVSDNDVHDFSKGDQHTKIGKILRKTSLDELPQLISIATGKMSFIGPRPWIPDYYENMNDIQRHRYSVRPGLTGLAQANGRNAISIQDKIKYDLEYIKNYSLRQDIKVVFLTIKAVFTGSGADAGKGGIEKDLKDLRDGNNFCHKVNKTQKIKKELVSIVVPIYNAERFLDDTINTVLNQSYEKWELLLINDCSSDNSKNVYEKYIKDKRIKWFKIKKNSGPALARNKGIELSNGSFVCFLDADDLWDKNKLEKQIEFMSGNNSAFSFTGYEFADENGVPNGKKVFVPEKINYKQALKNTTIWTSTVMFDMRKLSKKNIYMPNVSSEDTACWWKVLKKVDYAYGLNEILSFYRRSSGTLSSNKFIAIKRIWNLYRNVEKLSFLYSLYCFIGYLTRAIIRRI